MAAAATASPCSRGTLGSRSPCTSSSFTALSRFSRRCSGESAAAEEPAAEDPRATPQKEDLEAGDIQIEDSEAAATESPLKEYRQ